MKQKILILSKAIAFASLLSMISIGSYAQKKDPITDWTVLKSQNNISIYYKTDKCAEDKAVLIRIVNTGDHNAVVHWSLWDNSLKNQYSVASNSDSTGTCPTGANKTSTIDLADYMPSGKSIGDMNANFKIE